MLASCKSSKKRTCKQKNKFECKILNVKKPKNTIDDEFAK